MTDPLDIIDLPFGIFQAVCHVIRLADSCCLIDPAAPVNRLPAGLPPVRLILATHGHFDHISAADDWRRSTLAPLGIHANDRACLTDANRNFSAAILRPMTFQAAELDLTDGQILKLDGHHQLEVLHTPGHTAGGICLLLRHAGRPAALFTGDTLFAGSIGRLDLGGDAAAMRLSLRRLRRLAAQPGGMELPVYPGHGPATNLGVELAANPFFQDLADD